MMVMRSNTYLTTDLSQKFNFAVMQEQNTLNDGFFNSANNMRNDTYLFEMNTPTLTYKLQQLSTNGFLSIGLIQGQKIRSMVYSQVNLLSAMSSFAGLSLSLYGIIGYFIGRYQEFIVVKSMLKRLYGEEPFEEDKKDDTEASLLSDGKAPDKDEEAESRYDQLGLNDTSVVSRFVRKIKSIKDFNSSYLAYNLIGWTESLCCCCIKCCFSKFDCFRKRHHSYRKFLVAQERLIEEQDIQKMIAHNRVTRLINLLTFKERQRRTISYSQIYCVSESDILQDKDVDNGDDFTNESRQVADDFKEDKEELFEGFDPYSNSWDRRLLYEVTGLKIPGPRSTGPRSAKAGRVSASRRDETPEEEFYQRRTSSNQFKRNSSKVDRYSKIDLDELDKIMDKLADDDPEPSKNAVINEENSDDDSGEQRLPK